MRRMPFVVLLLCCSGVAIAQSQSTASSTTVQVPMSSAASQTPPPQPAAQQAPTFWVPAPEERWFLPKGNWIYGFVEWDFAPPHNEPDPNLCAANSGDFGGKNATCNAFARYLIPAEVYVRPFGKTALRRVRIFYDGTFIFGKNVPQFL